MPKFAASVADSSIPAAACFSVRARAEPGVMPRVLELFAKRGLVPSYWQSSTSDGDRSQLTINIQMPGLANETIDYMAACLRQIASVEGVAISQNLGPS